MKQLAVYLKSIAAGILSLILVAFVAFVVLSIAFRPKGTQNVGYDPTFLLRLPMFYVVVLITFLAGFYIEFRRVSRKRE